MLCLAGVVCVCVCVRLQLQLHCSVKIIFSIHKGLQTCHSDPSPFTGASCLQIAAVIDLKHLHTQMLVFLLWSVIQRLTEWCWHCDMNQVKLTIVLEEPEVIRINLSHSALAWINQIIPAAVQPTVASGRDQNVTQKKEGNATQVPCKFESWKKNTRCECGCRSGTSWIIILVSQAL